MDEEEALEEVRLQTAASAPSRAFWAGGRVRVGEFILLVDADTRVPVDSILPTVSELLRAPAVGYTQHFTLPLQACAHQSLPLCRHRWLGAAKMLLRNP